MDKAVLRGESVALVAYMTKEEKSRINKLSSCFKKIKGKSKSK